MKPIPKNRPKHNINEYISAKRIRIVGEDGKSEEVTLETGLGLAYDLGVDLIQINDADVPVCKLLEYSKFLYKLEKGNKKNNNTKKQKQIQFHPNIGDHDLQHKVKHIREFVEDGHRVEVLCRFAGRENKHKEFGFNLFTKVIESLDTVAKCDGDIKDNGNNIVMYLVKK